MKLFNDKQKAVIKAYILRTEGLFEDLTRDEDRNKVEEKTWFDQNTTKEYKRLLLENIVLSDEVLTRVYAILKFNNNLNDLFLNQNNTQVISSLTTLEQHLVRDYISERDGYSHELEHESLLAEVQWLWLNNGVWKLFENESQPQFLMPVIDEE